MKRSLLPFLVLCIAVFLCCAAAPANTVDAKAVGDGVAAASTLLPPPWNLIAGLASLVVTHVFLDKHARRKKVCKFCGKSDIVAPPG